MPSTPPQEEAVGNALMGAQGAQGAPDPMALIQMLLQSGQITPDQIPQILQMLGGAGAPPQPMEGGPSDIV